MNRNMYGNGISTNLGHSDNKVTLIGDYAERIHPYSESAIEYKKKTLNDMLPLTEETILERVKMKASKVELLSEETLKSFIELTNMVADIELLDKELAVIQTIKGYKLEVEQNEDTFNQSTRIDKKDAITVIIENAVYRLSITASTDSYRKNYQITGHLSVNKHLYSGGYSLETFENNSYSSVDKVETYIQNKLKKYKPLFTFNRAILLEHVNRYSVSPRLLRDMNIDVYASIEDLAKNEK